MLALKESKTISISKINYAALPRGIMKNLLLVILLLLPSITYSAGEKPTPGTLDLQVERLFSPPNLSGEYPRGIKFSPDGKWVTYLVEKKDKYRVLDLWAIDLKTADKKQLVDSDSLLKGASEKLSQEEKARRERMRISSKGIVQYFWLKDGSGLIFPIGGELYLYDLNSTKSTRLTNNKDFETDVQISPNSNFITYHRKKGLYKLDLKTKKERLLLKHPSKLTRYAVAEFVAQEEMGRYTGSWISNNEQYIAFTKVDESKVKVFERYDISDDKVKVYKQRYPKAGTPNAVVSLELLNLKTNSRIKIPINDFKEFYLARVKWAKDDSIVYFQIQNRLQNELRLKSYNLKTKKVSTVLTEKSKTWINLHKDFKPLKGGRFIWKSSKSGFPHLYLHSKSGKPIKQVTKGNFVVDYIVGIDQKTETIFYLANQEHPTERHLYKVSYAKDSKFDPKQITQNPGFHHVIMGKNKEIFYLIDNNNSRPERHELWNLKGKRLQIVVENNINDKNHPLNPYKDHLAQWSYHQFKSPTGTTLHYSLLKPKNFDESKKYPVIFAIYGGPGVQTVTKRWKGGWGLNLQVLANLGFVIVTADNRGSSRRGKVFEDALYLKMGSVEVEDQVYVANHLSKKPWFDSRNVGITGWSYGGYLSLMACAKAPKVFKACVSGAPVTDWSLYDTHYTERYMGLPSQNIEGYKNGNVMNFAKNIKGRVLLMHGMADDNVIFTHSTMLIKELQKQMIVFDSMFYPGARHGVRGRENRIHRFKTITDFFERYLK